MTWRDDPQPGDVIRLRAAGRRARAARQIITVDGERVETMGLSGDQRNRWMSRTRLDRYDLLRRDGACDCGAGWETFSGHSLACPRNAEAGRTRTRIEAEEYTARDDARRGLRVGGRTVGENDMPTPAEYQEERKYR